MRVTMSVFWVWMEARSRPSSLGGLRIHRIYIVRIRIHRIYAVMWIRIDRIRIRKI